jgi:Rrf2 family protein
MLSNTAEYALRAMVYLAREESAMLGRDLAESSRVPANYLSKILLSLKKGGLVAAVRGSGGGYRLARRAADIHLIDIVELFDHERAHPRCLLDFEQECNDHEACTAHERWKSVRAAYVEFLQTTSLADVAEAEQPPPKRRRPARR